MFHLSDFIDVWHIVPCLFVISAVAIYCIVRIRPLFPVRVTCWFCNGETKVPYGNWNCWDCPLCEQYNGFTKDGGYNKPIPAQYEEDLNYPMGCKKEEFLTRAEVLCARCTENQSTKIRLLAQFESTDMKNFDVEVTQLSQYLEDRYKLCSTCDRKVDEVVQEQDRIIKSRLNDSLRSQLNQLQAEKDQFTIVPFLDTNNSIWIIISYLYHIIEVVSSLGLALRQIRLDTDQTGILQAFLPQGTSFHLLLLMLDVYAWHMVITMILSGIIAKLLVTQERIVPIDFINSVFLLLVLITQSDLFSVFETGSLLDAAIFAGCHVTSVLCLLTTRKQYNPMYVMKSRKHGEYNDSVSSCNSSVNQSSFVTNPSHSLTSPSHSLTSPSHSLTSPSHSMTSPSHSMTSSSHSMRSSSHSSRIPISRYSNGPMTQDMTVNGNAESSCRDDGENLNLSFTVFKMESFNLGCTPPSYSGSWTRSRSNSVSSNHSSRSSYAGSLTARGLPKLQSRSVHAPLIAPSRFTPTVNHQRLIQPSASHGLNSSFTPHTEENNFNGSSNTGPHRLSNSFELPPRSHSPFRPPVITRFGASPYTMTALPSEGYRDTAKHNDMRTNSFHRSNSFKCLREEIQRDSEDEISDSNSVYTNSDIDDSASDFTSVSQLHTNVSHHRQPLQSTVNTTSTRQHRIYPWILAIVTLSIWMSIYLV